MVPRDSRQPALAHLVAQLADRVVVDRAFELRQPARPAILNAGVRRKTGAKERHPAADVVAHKRCPQALPTSVARWFSRGTPSWSARCKENLASRPHKRIQNASFRPRVEWPSKTGNAVNPRWVRLLASHTKPVSSARRRIVNGACGSARQLSKHLLQFGPVYAAGTNSL